MPRNRRSKARIINAKRVYFILQKQTRWAQLHRETNANRPNFSPTHFRRSLRTGALANMEWDTFEDDDRKVVKGAKWLNGIETDELALETLQMSEKKERDIMLLEKIDEARMLQSASSSQIEGGEGDQEDFIDVESRALVASANETEMTTTMQHSMIENKVSDT